MTKLTENQIALLDEASKTKSVDSRESKALSKFAPLIRVKIAQPLLNAGLLTSEKKGTTITYTLTEKGRAALKSPAKEDGSKSSAKPAAKKEPKPKAAAKKPAVAKEAPKKVAKPASEKEAKEPSKKQRMYDMLASKEGTTITAMQKAFGWQRHSVFGSMSNLAKERKLKLNIAIKEGGERIYKFASK